MCKELDIYLSRDGSPSAVELAAKIGCSPAQLSQWRTAHKGRRPGASYAMSIEIATGGAVMRWHLRPDDWHLIWPALKRKKEAPAIEVAV